MRIYQHAGYFRPDQLEELVVMARASGGRARTPPARQLYQRARGRRSSRGT